MPVAPPPFASFLKKRTTLICTVIALFAAIVPFTRAFFRAEVSYNEGWNIYNADLVAHHQLLYPIRYGWTTVNYPMLSFYLLAQLHRLTHDYLFTARILSLLSLIACSLLVAAIVRTLGATRHAAILAGLFCFAIFCVAGGDYIGADDPQLLAQVFFLLALFVYLRNRESRWTIALSALIFVIAGFIKHNPIDFPLAVLADLVLLSIPLALWFTLCGLLFAAVVFALNVYYGGPFFLAQLLAPRGYSFQQLIEQAITTIGPLLLPYSLAGYIAFTLRHDAKRRITLILFSASIVTDIYFGGGSGVSINAYFTSMLATSILIGLFFDKLLASAPSPTPSRLAQYAPVCLFLWLGIPLILSGNWNPIARLREFSQAQQHFDQDVAFLRNHPGPALCESLLECNLAGKPYLYDPFNATRLVQFQKLDANILINQIRQHHFATIQTDNPLPLEDTYNSERWPPTIRAAIEANYVPTSSLPNDPSHSTSDHYLYIPKPPPH